MQLFKVARPNADDEPQERETDAGQYQEAEHPERVRNRDIDKEERGNTFFKAPFNLKEGDLIVAQASAINVNGQGTSST